MIFFIVKLISNTIFILKYLLKDVYIEKLIKKKRKYGSKMKCILDGLVTVKNKTENQNKNLFFIAKKLQFF